MFISYASGYTLNLMCRTIRTLIESGFTRDVVLLPCTAGAYWCGVDTYDYPYRYVITTDLRDLLFQRIPSVLLEHHLGCSVEVYDQQLELVVTDEGYIAGQRQLAINSAKGDLATLRSLSRVRDRCKEANEGSVAEPAQAAGS
eukprot:m51a1_g11917 hypothetical protein (143) ;mRNA; r:661064-661690